MMIVPVVLLLIFWTGCFLILHKQGWDLSERAKKYQSEAQRAIANGNLSKGIKRLLKNRQHALMEQELSDCLAYIKNIVILGRGKSMSAQLLLEELAGISDALSPIFLRMAHCMHLCENQRAEQLFCTAFQNNFSKEIAHLLVEWERIPSEKLLGTIAAYRSVLLENRQSKQKKRDEIVSDIIYFPVVINSMAVLLNFIYVAYFLEQREALMNIF